MNVLDSVDYVGNSPVVVELTNLMRNAIAGRGDYEVQEVLEMYNEYFESIGMVKTPLGRMQKEKWEAMSSRGIVDVRGGQVFVRAIKSESEDIRGNTKIRTIFPIESWV